MPDFTVLYLPPSSLAPPYDKLRFLISTATDEMWCLISTPHEFYMKVLRTKVIIKVQHSQKYLYSYKDIILTSRAGTVCVCVCVCVCVHVFSTCMVLALLRRTIRLQTSSQSVHLYIAFLCIVVIAHIPTITILIMSQQHFQLTINF